MEMIIKWRMNLLNLKGVMDASIGSSITSCIVNVSCILSKSDLKLINAKIK